MSFIYNLKNNGPNTLPCGMPLKRLETLEELPSITVHWDLSVKKNDNQSYNFPAIPYHDSFNKSLEYVTESKAFFKSRYNTSTGTLTSEAKYQSVVASTRLVTVDFPF